MMGAGCREVGSTRSGVAGTPVAEEDEVPRPAFFGAAGCSAGEADEGVPASAEEPPFAAFVRSIVELGASPPKSCGMRRYLSLIHI